MLESPLGYREYSVRAADRQPLVTFMLDSLRGAGCRILSHSPPNRAPFRITFETPTGDRIGVVAYAFLANRKLTQNRPTDEHRFQLKYGSKDMSGNENELWQDPAGLYTTLLVGIDPELGIFVGADPVLHSPTKFFISIEFKEENVAAIQRDGWTSWERVRRGAGADEPTEVLVGGTAGAFLRYVMLEREAAGEDQGHRQLLAERSERAGTPFIPVGARGKILVPNRLHALAQEFELTEEEVLDLIAGARRLKMAVRGWVAEEHLRRQLTALRGVSECERLDDEGGPDISLRYRESAPLTVECKNVLRKTMADGRIRLDFQRTRAAKGDPCSRYYREGDFDVVAACLHSITERWEFRLADTTSLVPHEKCEGRLDHKVRLDDRWSEDAARVLERVIGAS